MINRQQCFFTLFMLALSTPLLAHEGHNDAPGAFKSNHGGVVKAGHEINLEFVSSGAIVRIFPISHDGKERPANELKLTATTKHPKGKPEVAKIEFKDGAFTTQVDFKGSYRVELSVDVNTHGKQDHFTFQVEK